MTHYSFLLSESMFKHALHPLKDSYQDVKKNIHFGNGYAFVTNHNKNENIGIFLGKIASSPNINIAIEILNEEFKKNIFRRLPKDVLIHTQTILQNSTEKDFRENINIYRNTFINQ